MKKSGRSLMVALLAVSLFAANIAEAARFGGGRSSGMRRSTVTRAAPQPAPQQAQPQTAPQQAPAQGQRSGPGWGGVAAGVAAGAATGYLVSKAMEPDAPVANASDVAMEQAPMAATRQQGGGIPWMWILLLIGATIMGARWFMRRQQVPAGIGMPQQGFDRPQQNTQKVFRMGEGMGAAATVSAPPARLPDGTETPAFLRQARATFQHIQSLNSPEQMEEVRKYLTPELFEGLKSEISANRELAEFQNLQADLLDSSRENGTLVASVRFSGQVSESLNAPMTPFAEIWHFIRPNEADPRWVLAGIEQA